MSRLKSVAKRRPKKRCDNCDWHMWDCCDIDGYCGNPNKAVRCIPGYRRGWTLKRKL